MSVISVLQSSFLCYKTGHWHFCLVLTGTVHHCNETLKAACAAILSLKSQQDAERTEHRRYNNKAREEVMRLQRRVDEADQQLKLETQKARMLVIENIYSVQSGLDIKQIFLEDILIRNST